MGVDLYSNRNIFLASFAQKIINTCKKYGTRSRTEGFFNLGDCKNAQFLAKINVLIYNVFHLPIMSVCAPMPPFSNTDRAFSLSMMPLRILSDPCVNISLISSVDS